MSSPGSYTYLLTFHPSWNHADGSGAHFFELSVRGGPADHKAETEALRASLESHFGPQVEIDGYWSGRVYGRVLRLYRETESALRDLDAASAKAGLPLAVHLGIDLIAADQLAGAGYPWHVGPPKNDLGCPEMFSPDMSAAHLNDLRTIWKPLLDRWFYPRHRLVGAARPEGLETLLFGLPPLETMIARAVVAQSSLRRDTSMWTGDMIAGYGLPRVRQAVDSLYEAGLLVEIRDASGQGHLKLRRGPLAGRIGKNWLLRL